MNRSKRQLFEATSDVVDTLIELPEGVCPITCAALALHVMFFDSSTDGSDELEDAVDRFVGATKGRSKLIERLLKAHLISEPPPWMRVQQPEQQTSSAAA